MSALTSTKKIVQYGLSEICSAPDPQVDIVFVHGLNGHPHHTWATSKPEVFWPADLLPRALDDQPCRILTYGYDANVGTFTDGASKDEVHNHAEHLASRLVANRSLKRATERPIIFVCHSLGGLVVKRCLIYCKNVRHAHTERLRSVYVSTYGILFLGTPHNGSDIAKWGTLLQSICSAVLPKKFFDSSPQLIEALKTNNVQLQNINRLFIEIIGRFHIYFFHESKPMDFKGTRHLVVDEDSAAPVIEGVERMGIERDHSHMCKFEDEDAPGYDVVAEAIQRYAADAPSLIQARWNEEHQIRDFERQGAARELLGDSIFQMTSAGHTPQPESTRPTAGQPVSLDGSFHSVTAIEDGVPLLIAPLGFRPNSLFLGFQIELDQIQQRLDNKKRKELGTCSVLVWGPAGCGKSYLARQYLWLHRNEYPGGSFWVDAKNEESRCRGFWDIGQAVALLKATDGPNRDWDSSKFVDAVRRWFETRDGWLLVFDGISFDSDEDIEKFMKFIPDRKGNNIIFTSFDRTLAKRQRLLDPPGIKVRPLALDDARTLLYSSLGIKEPSSAEIAKATTLVKHCEFLPLAIHASAHAIIAKGRTLERYSPGSTAKRLAGPYVEIMEALQERGHVEAVNLINLLSFFNHNVPVTLFHFGRKILAENGIEIRSVDREGSSKREIDNTIAVLIRYGLVERTLQPYQLDTSLSAEPSLASLPATNGHSSPNLPRQSIEMDPGPAETATGTSAQERPESSLESSSAKSVTYSIDILRVHTVVQDILQDEMKLKDKNREIYLWWLGVAARLLCESYKTANERISASSRKGLVRDYREYEIQGRRIWNHFPRRPPASNQEASTALRKARHDLHNVLRSIKCEIENRSPTQSFDSIHRRVQVSIFERAGSSSSGQETPNSNLTRTSTWSLGEESVRTKSESPTQIRAMDLLLEEPDSDDSWVGDEGDLPSPHSSTVTTRRSSESDMTQVQAAQRLSVSNSETTSRNPSRRPSFVQAIFKGRPNLSKQKDLGEWKPLPAPPSLTNFDVSYSSSRASSLTDERSSAWPITAGSEAEAALAAVHRFSPPSSRGGRIRSPSRPRSEDNAIEDLGGRKQLTTRSPNLQLSPLAAEFNPVLDGSPQKESGVSRRHSRHPSAGVGVTSMSLPPIPIDANMMPGGLQARRSNGPARSPPNVTVSPYMPSGYTSTPMSRDASKESNLSMATAPPAVPGSASLSASPNLTEPYIHSRPGPASIDVVAANADGLNGLKFGRVDEWFTMTPATPTMPFGAGWSLDGGSNRSGGGSVQFGQMDPVALEEARRRAQDLGRRVSEHREDSKEASSGK